MDKQKTRIEKDWQGDVVIAEAAWWGSSTERALELFPIGTEHFPPALFKALGYQKKAAALANLELGLLDSKVKSALLQAIDEVIAGKFNDQFPLPIWQTGSGTQTNMNCNEVIANRANELLGQPKGTKSPLHPNDHINRGQSSNDSFPTVMRIAVCQTVQGQLLPPLQTLIDALAEKAAQFADIVKIGRTHLMDAIPVYLSQSFCAWHQQAVHNVERLQDALKRVRGLPQGGTAAGSGLNADPQFAEHFIRHLREITGEDFYSLSIKNEGMSAHDALLELSGNLNVLAASLTKMANDIRWQASGPRGGIDELVLPVDGLTSSSMPGKVNPTQCEAMLQVCAQVMGNHVTITIAGSNGNFELNNWNPVIIFNLLQSIRLLSDVIASFTKNCLIKLDVNRQTISQHVERSLALATALNLQVGYDKASEIVFKAMKENISLQEAGIKLNYLTAEEYAAWVNPVKLAGVPPTVK